MTHNLSHQFLIRNHGDQKNMSLCSKYLEEENSEPRILYNKQKDPLGVEGNPRYLGNLIELPTTASELGLPQ